MFETVSASGLNVNFKCFLSILHSQHASHRFIQADLCSCKNITFPKIIDQAAWIKKKKQSKAESALFTDES